MFRRRTRVEYNREGNYTLRVHEVIGLYGAQPERDIDAIIRVINALAQCADPNTPPLAGCGWCSAHWFHALPLLLRHDGYPIVIGEEYGPWQHSWGASWRPAIGQHYAWREQSWVWVTARPHAPSIRWQGVGHGQRLEPKRLPRVDPYKHDHALEMSVPITENPPYQASDFTLEVYTMAAYRRGRLWPGWPCPQHY